MNRFENLNGVSIGALQRQIALDLLEIRILLCFALGLSRTQLITQSERTLTEAEVQRLSALIQRRLDGEPIAYITGEREFYGLPFRVSPAVLIPRPETELLVDLALERLPQGGSVLDMGTGSGAIAVAIAHARPDAQVSALDLSPAALTVAQENAVRILPAARLPIRFLSGNWYAGLEEGERFDLIVANPPYISVTDAHLSQGDLRFEPTAALTDGAGGLSALQAIAAGASNHLNPGGWLLLEHGFDQAKSVRNLLIDSGFSEPRCWQDLAGIDRISGGKLSC
jgi:release factor glutamine methyltransferase